MSCNLPESVVFDIERFAKKNKIKKVVLFGSRARGNHSERSDIDLAVSGELRAEIEKDGVLLYEEI